MHTKSLEYLIRRPKIEISKPPLLIMFHGYGSNEQDLFSFAEELPDELLIISARAPLSMGFGSYAWYTIHFDATTSDKFSDLPEARSALSTIDLFIEELKAEYEINEEKIFLLGFSQGTILSMAYALNHPDKIKKVIALSGYINEDLIEKPFEKERFKALDFFVSHGTVDQVIPVEWARKTEPFLNKLKIKNEYHEYPVGHGVAPQNFFDLQRWIKERCK
ncbi:alpha/beta fold hydrolase [Lutimonas saemankumensis]|uniref:alpha/beta hydrolase n=1 Tax=Lutimonas saemankumensis TaxID=483016 RepID=UPI001CD2D61B|nr:alpha/beta fold hydrolase [Lutimonas saemankumensis]MCA0932129.1 alpha/beta fold hydrolase [Lutimonas saemankumensis]